MSAVCPKCGGPATPIVGTFVLCAKCDGAPKPAVRRGEPGHVEMCACKRCQIRREVTVIELVGRAGEVIGRVPWDGEAMAVLWRPLLTGYIAHWRALDAEGSVVGDGVCVRNGKPDSVHVTADPDAGDYRLHLKWILGALLAMSVEVMPKPSPIKASDIPQRSTLGDIHAAAAMVPGVCGVRVQEDRKHGHVFVIVTETYADTEADEGKIINAVSAAARDAAPADVQTSVVRDTPLGLFGSAVRAAETAVKLQAARGVHDPVMLRLLAIEAATDVLRSHGGDVPGLTVTSEWNSYGDVRLRLHYKATWRSYKYDIVVHQ